MLFSSSLYIIEPITKYRNICQNIFSVYFKKIYIYILVKMNSQNKKELAFIVMGDIVLFKI